MMGFSRPLGPLLCCGGALGVVAAGGWVLAPGREAPVESLPATVVTALRPLPPPDSLAALLVSGPRSSRSSRGTTAILLQAVEAVDLVYSPSERADLLEEIVDFPELDSVVVAAVGQAAGRISSPSARARVLRALIQAHPHATDGARRPVLDAIGTIQSTPERTITLERFVTSRRLSQPALVDALVQAERLRVDNERSRVLIAAAGAQRLEGRARTVYMRAASSIRNERYRSRALAALSRRTRYREHG